MRAPADGDPSASGGTFTLTRSTPLSTSELSEYGERGRRLVRLELSSGKNRVTYHFVRDRRRLRYKVLDRASPLSRRSRERLRVEGWSLVSSLSAARGARLPSRYQYVFLKVPRSR